MSDDSNPYQAPGSNVSSGEQVQNLKTSSSALASGIIALVALALPALGMRIGFLWWGVILASCLGLGIHGLIQIYKNPMQYKGKGWAIWGLVYSVFIAVVATLSFAKLI